jgi:uncharacterized membrane protein
MKNKDTAGRYPAGLRQLGKSCLAKVKKIWPADYREANELLLIALIVVILPLIIIISPSNVLRIVLGLPLALFFPGYALLAAIYVRKGRLKGQDRLALSLAASVAVVPIIGLILNFVPGIISLASFYISLALFILVASAVAWIRRGRLAAGERFTVLLRWRLPSFGGNTVEKVLKVAAVLAAVAVVASFVYVIVVPKTQENFTEFYLSGLQDRSFYPTELTAGEEQKVLVTIVNRERRTLDYLVEVSINGVTEEQTDPLSLEQGEKYEAEMGFTPETAGARQEVAFTLYINGEPDPYLEPLHLWVDVK